MLDVFRADARRRRGCVGERLRLDRKAIPDAHNSEDETRLLGVRLELASQAADQHVDAALVGLHALADNRIAQLVAR